MSILRVENVSYSYNQENQPFEALNDVSFQVEKGAFTCILGHNGSGKSTLAKLLNGLYTPTDGKVFVKDMDTSIEANLLDIRRSAGMVFQNPDNQMVATVVEEDVAFGPENLGVPSPEIRIRVDRALSDVGMSEYAHSAPHKLSGGQKQRIAIAGVLAMHPEIMILDEPTAMLDPKGRAEVMETVLRLNKEQGITIIHITHFMEEAIAADRIIVLSEAKIALEGKPREVFSQSERLKELSLSVPEITAFAQALNKAGYPVAENLLTIDELTEAICQLI